MVVTFRLLVYLLGVAGIVLFNRRVNGGEKYKEEGTPGSVYSCKQLPSRVQGIAVPFRGITCISLSKIFLSINCDSSCLMKRDVLSPTFSIFKDKFTFAIFLIVEESSSLK